MESSSIRDILFTKPQAKIPGEGETALITDYRSLEDYFREYAEIYADLRKQYFDSTAGDDSLPEKTKRVQKAGRNLASFAETWFFENQGNDEEQQTAMNVLDMITKDAGIRFDNIKLYAKIMKEKLHDPKALTDLMDDVSGAARFMLSAVRTQKHFQELLMKSGNYTSFEEKEETESSVHLDSIKGLYPAGTIWRRAAIFPPARVPAGEPVPMPPDAYTRVQYIPADDLVYDPEADELVPRPGYVSEDGLVDCQSVVWHPDSMTVDMGFRGQEKVTWNYWKPKDIRDVMPPDSWCGEYNFRAYQQWRKDCRNGVFRRRPWEK